MSNINSYIVSKKERIGLFNPYNELDALVFARFSYLPLHKIKLDKNETIGSICEKLSANLKREDYLWPDDYDYVENMKNSPRFSKKIVTDYVRRNSTSLEKQFSALTIHLNHRKMYLSFFGTDDSLTGWKEDFNLAFLDHIPAQTEAKKYFNKVSKEYSLKKVFLGGHSKGGNLAIYSAITAPDSLQKHIKKVYNYDGPGLRKGTMALDAGPLKVTKKIQSVIPQGSVVGRLFEHNESVKVVKSNAKRLYQHDIYTWEIKKNSFVVSKNTKSSDLVDRALTAWLENAPKKEQKLFINSIFEVFSSADVNNPLELKKKWLSVMKNGLKNYTKLPKEERKMILDVWKKLGSAFIKARKG